MDWLNAVQTYVAVVESSSFVQAAQQLNITTSACSKRISWLESQLHCQLLLRTTRRVRTTEQGQQFYLQSCDWLSQFNNMRQQLGPSSLGLTGSLTIGAPAVSGSLFVTPLIASFLPKHPHLNIELLEVEPGEIPDLSLDIVVTRQLDNFDSTSYRMLHLFNYAVKCFASPTFLAGCGPIQSAKQLQALPLLLVQGQIKAGGVKLNEGTVLNQACRFVTHDPMAAIQAAVHHMGVVLVSEDLVQQHLLDGKLVEVLPGLLSEQRSVCAYYPAQRFENPNISAFLQHLREQSQAASNNHQ
ncbi:LysR family transcriptional regulator [Agarivorans sp. OAG1]|uniref:LysR family transcriptional regulator n=1 Tax=unclassified Agarivorans TaxID=2636026 RepID=UPI00128B2BED|nr:LysR family transcriptional regulator [Agarivorans sp. B2Z047]MPW30239.1 LysR family transcriptional regulator [Agarivorans sp. B2Z047]UQN43131.1 LysR family transcriptional regulator [Agarivorans sp. B2Z047]BEU01438.1 LysR family transcriptional regulator [Agarivorans sp. OAG1]